MNIWQKLSQACVILLMLMAAMVSILLIWDRSAWLVIICYWVVLTGKNACDVLANREK